MKKSLYLLVFGNWVEDRGGVGEGVNYIRKNMNLEHISIINMCVWVKCLYGRMGA